MLDYHNKKSKCLALLRKNYLQLPGRLCGTGLVNLCVGTDCTLTHGKDTKKPALCGLYRTLVGCLFGGDGGVRSGLPSARVQDAGLLYPKVPAYLRMIKIGGGGGVRTRVRQSSALRSTCLDSVN